MRGRQETGKGKGGEVKREECMCEWGKTEELENKRSLVEEEEGKT